MIEKNNLFIKIQTESVEDNRILQDLLCEILEIVQISQIRKSDTTGYHSYVNFNYIKKDKIKEMTS